MMMMMMMMMRTRSTSPYLHDLQGHGLHPGVRDLQPAVGVQQHLHGTRRPAAVLQHLNTHAHAHTHIHAHSRPSGGFSDATAKETLNTWTVETRSARLSS